MLRKLRCAAVLLLVFGLATTLMGTEWTNHYFPDAVGSYWTYQDQDGNALTRYAVEPEEIDGETYQVFSYDPPLESWENFEHYIQPYLYQVSDGMGGVFRWERNRKRIQGSQRQTDGGNNFTGA